MSQTLQPDLETILVRSLDDLNVAHAETIRKRMGTMEVTEFVERLAPMVLCRIYEAL